MSDTVKLSTGAAARFTKAAGKSSKPAMLIVHGWGSTPFSSESYAEVEELLAAAGYHTLLLSLRGHKGAQGNLYEVTRAEHQEDIRAALKYLSVRSEVLPTLLGAVGVSYGAYLLCTLIPEMPTLSLLAMRAPALYTDEGWDQPTNSLLLDQQALIQWRSARHAAGENKALQGLAGYTGKLLIIWSEKDEQLPAAVLDSYRGAFGSTYPVFVIKGARHSLTSGSEQQYIAALETWVKKNYPDS